LQLLIGAGERYYSFLFETQDSVCGVPKPAKSASSELPVNNTVKLTENLRTRVSKAMDIGGFSVWSEFCRVALTEKCQTLESELRERDPVEFMRVYGKGQLSGGIDGKASDGRERLGRL
jgi:hypothetical protein